MYKQCAIPRGLVAQAEQASERTSDHHATSFLAIPKLGKDVPLIYLSPNPNSLLQLSSRLIELGLIAQKDIEKNPTCKEVCLNVLERHFNKHLQGMKLIDFNMNIDELSENCLQFNNDGVDDQGNEITIDHLAFYLTRTTVEEITIGKTLAALEKIHVGLGQTMYGVLCFAADSSTTVFTFYHMLLNLPYEFHLDEDTFKELVDGGEEVKSEEEWLEGVPTWMGNPQLLLDREQVARIKRKRTTPKWAKQIIDNALELANSYELGKLQLGFTCDDLTLMSTTLIIRHDGDDQMENAINFLDDSISGCGDCYSEELHRDYIRPKDQAHFKEWLQGVEKGCDLIRAIDQLAFSLKDAA